MARSPELPNFAFILSANDNAVPTVTMPAVTTPPSSFASVLVIILSVDATPVNPEPLPVIIPVTDIPFGLTTYDAVPPATTPT